MKNMQLSDAMSAAEADDRKTVTRRIIMPGAQGRGELHSWDGKVAIFGDSIPDDPVPVEKRPRYRVGDPVYFGEALVVGIVLGQRVALYRRDRELVRVPPPAGTVEYWKWKRDVLPPRYCPFRCARRFGIVTSVQPVRLHDIDAFEVRREGLPVPSRPMACWCESDIEDITADHRDDCPWRDPTHEPCGDVEIDEFAILWNKINGPGAFAWDPWVWRYQWRSVSREKALDVERERKARAA